jgi:uncharacterized protein YjbI with pentapeptide repeats
MKDEFAMSANGDIPNRMGPKRIGLRSLIAHVSLRYRARRERKQMHPIQLGESEIAALDMLARGAFVEEAATLRMARLRLPGSDIVQEVSLIAIAEFERLGFLRRNRAETLVLTDRGIVAARAVQRPDSSLRANATGGNSSENLVRDEFEMRVRRHAKWIAGVVGGKRLSASFIDLEGSTLGQRDLREIVLEGSILREGKFRGTQFLNATLHGCDFTEADCREASFRSADLRGCDFTGARLEGTDMSSARLGAMREETLLGLKQAYARALAAGKIEQGSVDSGMENLFASFDHATMAGANLRGADLSGASMRHADLVGADLRECNMSRVDLAYADLTGAKVFGARWAGASLKLTTGIAGHPDEGLKAADQGTRPDPGMLADAIYQNKIWVESNIDRLDGAIAPKGARALLANFNLSERDLRNAALAGADLRNTNLSGADLRNAMLVGADLRGANLARALVAGADMRGAKLSDSDTSY